MGAVEVDAAGSVLRAAGGSEEPLSISDTGDKTWICCWEEATSLCFTFFKRLHFNTNCCSCFLALGYKYYNIVQLIPLCLLIFHTTPCVCPCITFGGQTFLQFVSVFLNSPPSIKPLRKIITPKYQADNHKVTRKLRFYHHNNCNSKDRSIALQSG